MKTNIEKLLPAGYDQRPFDYDGPLFTTSQMLAFAARCMSYTSDVPKYIRSGPAWIDNPALKQ